MLWLKKGYETTGTCWAKYPKYQVLQKVEQEALALSAGIDRSYISEIELAKSSVSLDILERLARALNVDPQTLLAPRGNREQK